MELELALELALAAEMDDDEELQYPPFFLCSIKIFFLTALRMLMGRSRSNSNVSAISSTSVTSGSEDTLSVTDDDASSILLLCVHLRNNFSQS